MHHRKTGVVLAGLFASAVVAAAGTAQAVPVIDVGEIELQPDTPDQQVEIYVTGGDAVQGLNLNVQVEDGGPELAEFIDVEGIDGPAITDVDTITGTIFQDSNLGEMVPQESMQEQIPQLAMRQVETNPGVDLGAGAGFVEADGLVATITFDTTGFTTIGESFELRLAGTANEDTTFAGDELTGIVETQVTNGTLVIVPEPASLGLLSAGGLLLCRRRRI